MHRLPLLALALISFTSICAADWPCWRGPDGLGVSPESPLPIRWSQNDHIAWRIPLPGKGASSPVVVGDRIYLTTKTDDTGLHVLAIDRQTGQTLWDREVSQGKLPAHNLHNMATPTAVADRDHVWVVFGTGDFACLRRDGTIRWQRNFIKEFGPLKTNHGYGSSPMLEDGKLYLLCMHQGPSWVLAVDALSGKDVWKKERNLEPKDEAQDSYSSPLFLRYRGKTSVVVAGAETVNAYDPATGEELWSRGGMKVPHPYGRTIAGLAAGDGTVIAVASGFQNRGYTLALPGDRRGKLTDQDQLWTLDKFSPDCPTPLVYQGKVYSIRDDGIASCVDLKTGQAHWQERLFSANVKVSPVAGDGKVYFLNGQGNSFVVNAAPKLDILATNSLNEATLSSPAISDGRIYIRTDKSLWCVSGSR
jgi:outer membrane protein assembly factor BamB